MTNEIPSLTDKPTRPELSGQIVDKRPLIITAITAVVLLLFFVLIIYLLSLNEATTANIRDISIILLAVINMFFGFVLIVLTIVLVYLAMKINDLVLLLNTEIRPVLSKASETAELTKETVGVIRSRTTFVGDAVVKPIINLLSAIGAVRAILRSFFRGQ